jgi:hypothetical protein
MPLLRQFMPLGCRAYLSRVNNKKGPVSAIQTLYLARLSGLFCSETPAETGVYRNIAGMRTAMD